MGIGQDARNLHGEANNAASMMCMGDAGLTTVGNQFNDIFGLQRESSMLPPALGHAAGALSGIGLGLDIYDMATQGVNVNNSMSAVGNGLGLGSWALGTFGAAGGAASTVAAPLMAAAAGGMALGNMGNEFIAETGWLGQNDDGSNRSWSDMGADWATAADEWAGGGTWGTIAGIGAGLGGALVGTAGTIATAPLAIADTLWDAGGAAVDFVGDVGSGALDLAGDAVDFVSSW